MEAAGSYHTLPGVKTLRLKVQDSLCENDQYLAGEEVGAHSTAFTGALTIAAADHIWYRKRFVTSAGTARTMVTLNIKAQSGTAGVGAIQTSSTALPTRLRPSVAQSFTLMGTDNGATTAEAVVLKLTISTAGIMTISQATATAVFTNGAAFSVNQTSVTYFL